MRSMLENLNLEPRDGREPAWQIIDSGLHATEFVFADDYDRLKKALVAALGVMDFERGAANTPLATSDPEGHRQSIIDHHDELVRNLETALEPFKVEGGDVKDGV